MLTRLVEYVLQLSPENVQELWIEDIACCAAWWAARSKTTKDAGPLGHIADTIAMWTETVAPRRYATEGRHQQPLLRSLLDTLMNKGVAGLEDDEVYFLDACYRVAQAAHDPQQFQRPRMLLEPHAADLEARRDRAPGKPDLPALGNHVRIIPGPDLSIAKPREVKVMAGIDVGCVGPVFTHTGHLRVLGNVPEDVIVVVERGSCYVGGYLLGRVAATGDCEVFDNISGFAVTRQGNLRARNIIDGAFVVAKNGCVYCRETQRPKLIFGGTRMAIGGDALLGRYVSPNLRVAGDVRGGECITSGSLHAGSLRSLDSHPLTVVFREELSGRDYGEVTSHEAQALIQRANGLRYRLRQVVAAAVWFEQEADESAANALLSLCGGDSAHERIAELHAKERRLAFLRRIIAGIQAISSQSEPSDESAILFRAYAMDVDAISSTDAEDADLVGQHREIMHTWQTLLKKKRDTGLTSTLLARLREQLKGWVEERQTLAMQIANAQTELRAMVDSTGLLKAATTRRAKVQLLRRFVTTVKSKGTNDAVSRRLESGFVHLIFRTIRAKLERADKCLHDAEELRTKLGAIADTLRNEYQVSIPGEPSKTEPPSVTARFAQGVRIAAQPHETPHNLLHALDVPDSLGEIRTYTWTESGILETQAP